MQRWASFPGIKCELLVPDVLGELRRHWLPVSVPAWPAFRPLFRCDGFRAMLEFQT
jgi:hypothetical protein